MAHVYISTVGATLIALFSMTAVAETPPSGTSGIEGTIVVSPTRPGPIRKDEEPSVAPVRNARFAIKAGDATVKTFRKRDGHVWLIPQNPAYTPISGDNAKIIGKVVAVLRRM